MAEQMSWAGARETKLEEDKVYSLLGIFDIHLPLIYGESLQHARERLQFEVQMRTIRQEQPVEKRLDPDDVTSNASPSTRHSVRRNCDRVHVTIVYWEIDRIGSLIRRLSDVLGRLYLYEIRTICLTLEYSPIDRGFPWQDDEPINNQDVQILYCIGKSHWCPEEAAWGFMDVQAVSHSSPLTQRTWLSCALGIPNLFSDVLVVLDCHWPGHSLVNIGDIIGEIKPIIEQVGDDIQPDWRGDTGASSFTLAPLWA